MKIVADSHIPFINKYFGGYGELILKPGRAISHSDVRDADILIVRSITHINEALLKNTKVKFVGSVTAGADHMDTNWLNDAGIAWTVATGFNAPPVADYVLSAMAALQKKKILTKNKIKVAVIGVGNVGTAVVERLKILDMDLILCDPLRSQKEINFKSVPIDEISEVDFISLHVPLTKNCEHATYHFIDKTFLQRQKAGCVLLNASRGAVVSSFDLLENGKHLHWCFDVWEHEPKINKKILERVLIGTPHIAGYSVQSKIRGIDMIYRIACEKKIINPSPAVSTEISSLTNMTMQQLSFAGKKHDWQDIVLGIFNPIIITEMMRTILLPLEESGSSFDEMRNQFNYRYEFAYTKVQEAGVSERDGNLLRALGLSLG